MLVRGSVDPEVGRIILEAALQAKSSSRCCWAEAARPLSAEPWTESRAMEAYETVRKLPQKGGFGEIYVVRKKADGKGSPTFIMKRARLAK